MQHAIVPVHAPVAALRGRALVLAQRAAATEALHASAARCGAPATFERDANGAPRARDGWWWSTAHTDGLAVAALARTRLGVDVERLARPRLAAARAHLARDLALLGRDDDRAVVSLWSACEAVVKRAGVGVAGLPHCRLIDADGSRWRIAYRGAPTLVHVHHCEQHVIAIAAGDAEVAAPVGSTELEASA
ncbi:MAG: 4'-phosphopantetheinyl transferase superfamily protein [Planctomycetota bacterium]